MEHGADGLLARYGVKAMASPDNVRLEPAALEADEDARIRRIVSQQDAHLVTLQACGEKVRRRVELRLVLPGVADVVTGRRERVSDTEGDAVE